jgi:hypothetical protein
LQVFNAAKVVICLERELESGGFEMQPDGFFESEEEIHVVDGLPAGPFEEVVDDRGNEQFAPVLLQVEEAFVGVDHLFEIGR